MKTNAQILTALMLLAYTYVCAQGFNTNNGGYGGQIDPNQVVGGRYANLSAVFDSTGHLTGGSSGGGGGWKTTGNADLNPYAFLGTTDSVDLIVKTKNVERERIYASGGYIDSFTTSEGLNASVMLSNKILGLGVSGWAASYGNAAGIFLGDLKTLGQSDSGIFIVGPNQVKIQGAYINLSGAPQINLQSTGRIILHSDTNFLNGQLVINNNAASNGYVLTTDAIGNATWENLNDTITVDSLPTSGGTATFNPVNPVGNRVPLYKIKATGTITGSTITVSGNTPGQEFKITTANATTVTWSGTGTGTLPTAFPAGSQFTFYCNNGNWE